MDALWLLLWLPIWVLVNLLRMGKVMRKIVGANINGTITNSAKAIVVAVEHNIPIEFLDQQHMKLMSACDLGRNWDKMAESPVLFVINDDGSINGE